MIIYEYKCDSCKEIFQKEYESFPKEVPKFIYCPKCNKKSYRVFSNSSVVIPDHFKATNTLYHNNTGSDYHYMKHRLQKGVRPSGKEKVYF